MPVQGTGSRVCGMCKCGRGPGAKVPLEASSSTEQAWDGLVPGDQKAHTACGTCTFSGAHRKKHQETTAEAHDLHWVLCILNSNPKNSQDVRKKKK